MAKIIHEENLIRIKKEPFVIFPLKKWEEIKRILEGLEDNIRHKTLCEMIKIKTILTLFVDFRILPNL